MIQRKTGSRRKWAVVLQSAFVLSCVTIAGQAFAQTACLDPGDPPFNPIGSEVPIVYDCHDLRETEAAIPDALDDFAAFHTRLPAPDTAGDRARDPRDEGIHPITGGFTDVVVNLPSLGRLEFGRRTSYRPVWIPNFSSLEVDRVALPEIVARTGDGDSERPDRINRHSFARIVENGPSEAIVHWRYARDPCDPTPTGIVHEFFTIRDDGTVSREVYPGATTLGEAAEDSNNTSQELLLTTTGVTTNSTTVLTRAIPSAGTAAAATSAHPVTNPTLNFLLDDRTIPPSSPVTAESVSQTNATLGGRLPTWYEGVSGSALSFDGYTTEVGFPVANPPAGSFTVEAWVSLAAYPFGTVQVAGQASVAGNLSYSQDPVLSNSTFSELDANDTAILDPPTLTVGGTGYLLAIDALGQPSIMANIGESWTAATGAHLPLHQWHHLAGVYSAVDDEIILYVNGVEVATAEGLSGSLTPASASDFVIGRNREPQWVTASGPIHVDAFQNAIFGVEGLLDEVRLYDRALTQTEVTSSATRAGASTAASLPPRTLPSVSTGSSFALSQQTISYHAAWDQLAHDSGYDDVLVTYQDPPTSVAFWKAMSYAPAWISSSTVPGNNDIWAHDQSMEWGDDHGLSEHMSDKDQRYAHVRVLEDTPARKVVHWRYAPVGITYRLNAPLGDLGWADEYYTMYPDGTTVRYVDDWWCSVEQGVPAGYQGTYFANAPGERWQDAVEDPIATVVGATGSSIDVSIVNTPPGSVTPLPANRPTDPAIVVTNTRSTYRRFLGLTTGSDVAYSPNVDEVWDMEAVVDDPASILTPFFRGDHFPVAKIPSDGRFALFPDRIGHSEDFLAISTESAPQPNKMMLNGFTQTAAAALPMVNGWNNAPSVSASSLGTDGFIQREHAYHFDGPGDSLTFTLAGATAIQNPGVVIFDWTGNPDVTVTVDGSPVTAAAGIHYNSGVRTLVASFPLSASNATVTIVPEPASATMLLVGALSLALYSANRRSRRLRRTVPVALTALMKLMALMAAGILAFLPAATAAAATLTVSGGQLTGATGVDVDGMLYDVTFVETSCVALFDGCDAISDFDFDTPAAAQAAAQALLDQVFLDVGAGSFDTDPELTAGCEDTAICVFYVPFDFVNPANIVGATAQNRVPGDPLNDLVSTSFQGTTTDTASIPNVTFAKFTANSSTGTLSGILWEDLDEDGLIDAAEPRSIGVEVQLRSSLPDISAITTDQNGAYAFPMLAPDTYTVTVITPVGLAPGFDADGGMDATATLSLANGELRADVDFASITLPPIQFEPVALTDTVAPGTDPSTTFAAFGTPTIAVGGSTFGRAIFAGALEGPTATTADDDGIWSNATGALSLLVREGQPAPGTEPGVVFGSSFGSFNTFVGRPALDRTGQAIFGARLIGPGISSANDQGIWRQNGSSFEKLFRIGDQAPGIPPGVVVNNINGKYEINARGDFRLQGFLSGPGIDSTNDTGIWKFSNGVLELVVREDDPAPGLPNGVVFGFMSPSDPPNRFGRIAFDTALLGTGIVPGSNDRGLFVESSSDLNLVARRGDVAPGTSATFSLFPTISLRGSATTDLVSFVGTLAGAGVDSSNDIGVWSDSNGTLELVAREGDPAPEMAAGVTLLEIFEMASNDRGEIAFGASLAGPSIDSTNNQGIWLYNGVQTRLALRTGDPAIGAGGGVVFSELDGIQFGEGGQLLAFILVSGPGISAANQFGAWTYDETDGLGLLVRSGDVIDVDPAPLTSDNRTIAGDGVEVSPILIPGRTGLRLSFTDGSSGAFVAVPDVGGPVALAAGALFLSMIRRKRAGV